ncbi:YhgE/Pip domain-containing protein [uncultured Clostridium sp.]|uniref:YhgE/Pip domain-containing protein n=1 Tax=uncultured Clostridium sp. TaxID=59620 RepID=UPI002628FE9F|nr:YhgE/Pip domain-containing protein [uncultured Clostridium sp.]
MKIFEIFKKDLKNIVRNKAAIAIICGLCIIPSFYTWITLKANWNPYVDTGNVPVAVVNNDSGAIINNKIVNFGSRTVDELKHNNTIKWTFVGQQVADKGLKDGTYYAVVEIPSNFSNDLKTIYSGNPVKPDLIYKVNEKTNAIATKITDLATNQLQGQIKQTFFDDVNKTVLTEGNSLGKKIETNKPMILEVKNVISNTNKNIGNILDSVNSSTTSVGELSNYLSTLKNNLPKVEAQINKLQGVVKSSKYLIQSTKDNMSGIESNLNQTNSNMQTANNNLQNFISDLRNTIQTQQTLNINTLNSSNSTIAQANANANNSINSATNGLNTVKIVTDKAKQNINAGATSVNDNAKALAQSNGKILSSAKDVVDKNSKAVNGDIGKTKGENIATVNNAKDTAKNDEKTLANSAVVPKKVSSNIAKTNTQIATENKKVPVLTKEQIERDKKTLDSAISTNQNVLNLISSAQTLLQTLNNIDPNSYFNTLISDLNSLKTSLNNQNASLQEMNVYLGNQSTMTTQGLNNKLNALTSASTTVTNGLNDFTTSYSNTASSGISSLNNNLTESLNDVSSILQASNQMIPQMDSIAKIGISSSAMTASQTKELSGKLDSLKNNLTTLQKKTSNLNNKTIDNLVTLLNKNPEQLSSLLSSPVGVKVQELYGMSIFGIGLAPFYTVLSIWVGALLCTTIISVNDKSEENGTKKRLIEIHFGKMLLFLAINFIQATIVTVGDVVLLGVDPANFWMLMGFAWFSGVVFTVIIFTMVSLMGNFGKAGALVVMVVQVAGSGAIYPIEVNPIFFQKLEFLWPFTYSVDGFRQAIGGAYMPNVYHDIIALLIFLAIFIAMAGSKIFMHGQTEFLQEMFEKSEL